MCKDLNTTLNFCQTELKKLTGDDNISGIIITIFHFILIISIIYISFITTNKYTFYIITFIVIIIFLLYLYFKGCILLKLERRLYNDKNWFGIYMVLPYFGISINRERIKNIVSYGVLPAWVILYLYKFNQIFLKDLQPLSINNINTSNNFS